MRKQRVKIPVERREKIGFHALRHTAASWLVQDGTPLYEVARILGHGSLYVTERYSHLVPGFAQVSIDRLGQRIRLQDLPPPSAEGLAPVKNARRSKSPPDSAGASAVAS